MNGSKLMDTLEQLAVDIFAREGLRQKLAEGRPLRVNLGLTPPGLICIWGTRSPCACCAGCRTRDMRSSL